MRLHALFATALGFVGGPAAAQSAAGGPPPAAVEPLPQVVVTGARFADEARNLPFGVSVITAGDIQRAGVTTVNEAVMKLLGVPGRTDFYGGGDYALDLRGFGEAAGSNQVIVVDGLRLNEGDTSTTRLAGIPIDTVERIEVLRGSGTVLYGEGATGGVLIITTKAGRGVGRATQGQVYGAVGSFNTRELRASATLAQDDVSLDLALNKRLSDNHRDHFRSDTRGAAVGLQWRSETTRLAIRHAQDELDTDLPGELTGAEFTANPRQSFYTDTRAQLRNAITTATADTRLGDWELGANLGHREKALRSLSSFARGSAATPYDYDVRSQTFGVRARHRSSVFGLDHHLAVGFEGGNWQREGLTFGDIADETRRGLYLRDELVLPAGTRLSAGVRREHLEKAISVTPQQIDRVQRAWELGVVQPMAPGVTAYARLANSFRLANVDEFAYKSPTSVLQPQTSRDQEMGLRWQQADTRAEVRVYRNRLTDEIGYDPDQFENVNFAPTRRQGLEFDASHRLSRSVQVHGHLAWRDARFLAGVNAGRKVPLTTHQTASVGADWQVAPQHQLGASLQHVGSRHPDLANRCVMPSYTTLDLRYGLQLQGGEFSVGVGNVTNASYYTQAFRCDAATGDTSAIYPEPGRHLSASARWRF